MTDDVNRVKIAARIQELGDLRDSVGCVSFRQLPHICNPYFYGIPPFLWHSVSFVAFRQFCGIPSVFRLLLEYVRRSVCRSGRYSVSCASLRRLCAIPSEFRHFSVSFLSARSSFGLPARVSFRLLLLIPSVARHSVSFPSVYFVSVFRQHVLRSVRQVGYHSVCCSSFRRMCHSVSFPSIRSSFGSSIRPSFRLLCVIASVLCIAPSVSRVTPPLCSCPLFSSFICWCVVVLLR